MWCTQLREDSEVSHKAPSLEGVNGIDTLKVLLMLQIFGQHFGTPQAPAGFND
jgi:hypothetical protein